MSAGHNKKQVVMDSFQSEMQEMVSAVVADYRGLSVAELSDLRVQLHHQDAKLRVIKNTLMKRLVQGTNMEGMSAFLQGPTAIVYSKADPVAPAKILKEYLKKNKKKNELRGGFLSGKVLSATEVQELADLPSIEELRAKLAGALAAPLRGVASAVSSQQGALVRSLNQVAEKKQQEGG